MTHEKIEKMHLQDLTIDLEGIENRIVELPVAESLYEQIIGLSNKVLFTEFPLTGELEEHEEEEKSEKHKGVLWCYDFKKQELQEWFSRRVLDGNHTFCAGHYSISRETVYALWKQFNPFRMKTSATRMEKKHLPVAETVGST